MDNGGIISLIHIVGGGPSGSIAAQSALSSEHDVIISEEHHRAGIPQHCSGLFSVTGLESLKEFVDYKQTIVRPMYGADIHMGSTIIPIRKKEPVAYVCKRWQLDQLLLERAMEKGATVRFGKRITTEFCSDHIIGADGPLSRVAYGHNFPKITRYVQSLQATIPLKVENPDIVSVFVSPVFKGFFGWIIPHDESTAEIGCGVVLGHDLRRAWEHLCKLSQVTVPPKPVGALIPIKTRSKTALRKGKRTVLLVGDAAGHTKATTGGGVIFGGNCARFAGLHATDPSAYEWAWKRKFGADMFIHQKVEDFLYKQNAESIESLGKRLEHINITEFLSQKGHMDKPTKMISLSLAPYLVRAFIS